MARTSFITEEEIKKAKKVRDEATSVAAFRKAISVILRAELGLDADSLAEILGTSRSTVFRDRDKIRNQDDASTKSWGGRRHFTMTFEEEREFLAKWETEARAGGVIAVPPIHADLVKRLGRNIPPSTTYRMLARHRWRKVQPDTKHPKSDPAAQEEYKKNYRKLWQPPT